MNGAAIKTNVALFSFLLFTFFPTPHNVLRLRTCYGTIHGALYERQVRHFCFGPLLETALMNAVSKRDNLTQQNLLLTSYDKSINNYNNKYNKTSTKSSTSNPTITQAPSPVKMSHSLHTPPSVPYPDPEPIDPDVLVLLEHEWTWWHDGMSSIAIFLDFQKIN